MSLSVQAICKSYSQKVVLNQINLELKAGEIVGFLGPNGAGKSTLLRCLNGLEDYSEGTAEVMGHEVSKLKPEELKELRESEMWQAGKTVRSLRPENQAK
jgi:D-methionine transport system ATP-binding protein